MQLVEILWTPSKREALVADCARCVETHIAQRGGLRGVGLRAAFGIVRSLKPDALARTFRTLTPEFLAAIEPLYQEFTRAGGGDFSGFLVGNADRVIAAMLSIADARAARSGNAVLKSAYSGLRSTAESELRALLPALAAALGKSLTGSVA